MKILYFDCAAGVSGEMITGALLDLGLDIHFLAEELSALKLGTEYEITVLKTQKCGISASQFIINTEDVPNINITADELVKTVWSSGLKPRVKQITTAAILRLLKAESTVFDKTDCEIIFSLPRAVKTVVSIVSCAILTDFLKPDRIIFSPLFEGNGFVNISGNIFSIPEPVVSEILRERSAPINSSSIPRELITPVGAAISCELAENFSELPPIIIKSVGYGAAHFDLDDRPAVLRIISGETQDKLSLDVQTDFDMETSGLFFDDFAYNMNTNFQKTKEG